MRRTAACSVIVILSFFPIPHYAQEVLTNESIVKLVKAGLGEVLIVQMINSQPGRYKTTSDDILILKKQGVSDRIIQAMLNRSEAGQGNKPADVGPELSTTGYPTEIGVYWKKSKEWIEIMPEVINWKTGGVFKSLATAGIVKGDVNGHLDGKQSRNRVVTPLEFLIYTPEGVAITEYQLLKLRENKNNREFRTVTGGILHSKGGTSRDLLPLEGKKVASRTYVVTLTGLRSGEYGFLPPGAFTSSTTASIGKMHTFSILE
jgi:hypothetical protein